MSTPSSAIMARLKSETQDLHDAAETHAHQTALVKGELPLERYVAHLEQHLFLHDALESELRAHFDHHPAFRAVITDEQFQVPYLREDLTHFERRSEDAEATPETAAVVEQIHRAAAGDPLKLLGYHYVLEGSNNGNRFIAMKLKQVYNLDGAGLRYLDPYGADQRPKWIAFKEAMSSQRFTPEQEDTLVEAAREMFAFVARISDGLLATSSA